MTTDDPMNLPSSWRGLKACRRTEEEDAVWTLSSGNCLLEDGCLHCLDFPAQLSWGADTDCEVTGDPEWTGFIHVEWLRYSWSYVFFIDGVETRHTASQDRTPQQSVLHGMEPRSTIYAPKKQNGPWKLCHAEVWPPWRVTYGECIVGRAGWIKTPCLVNLENDGWIGCHYGEQCTIEISPYREGAVDVVNAGWDGYSFETDPSAQLDVNGRVFQVTTSDDLAASGLQGINGCGLNALGASHRIDMLEYWA